MDGSRDETQHHRRRRHRLTRVAVERRELRVRFEAAELIVPGEHPLLHQRGRLRGVTARPAAGDEDAAAPAEAREQTDRVVAHDALVVTALGEASERELAEAVAVRRPWRRRGSCPFTSCASTAPLAARVVATDMPATRR